ncbi:hypothetical protein BTI_2776 [Burkholderia thailandensis MSMB121]|nr:hypothetical protein BTI_2776 [Burkholderia thailandensis MSMB121]
MTPRPALSTPRPLPRKRKRADKRPAITLASVDGNAVSKRVRGLTPAKAIQKNETPRARRKASLSLEWFRTRMEAKVVIEQ